jgi:hypothetical protein
MHNSDRRLFIHVGPTKTGTSAVQHLLARHDGPDVLYPKVGQWSDGAHHNLVLNYFGDRSRPEMVAGDAKAMLREIAASWHAHAGNMLISSEGLVNHDLGRLVGDLIEAFDGQTPPIVFILVCREHFERASSVYNQRVKDPEIRETLAPSPFLINRLSRLTYMPIIRRLQQLGFPVDVLNYHPDGDFVRSFLRHIGYAAAETTPISFRNGGISIKPLIALLAMNRVANTREERLRYLHAALGMRHPWSRARFIFAPPAVAAALPVFAADRDALAAQFGIALPTPDVSTLRDLFHINADELAEIAALCQDFGAPGAAALEIARAYLDDPSGQPAPPFHSTEFDIMSRPPPAE